MPQNHKTIEVPMNIEELNEQLFKARQDKTEYERLQRSLERTEGSLASAQTNLKTLADALRKENEDVLRLEGTSLVGIIYAVLGRKESRLDEERRELLAAKFKHDTAARQVTGLERDVEDLSRQLAGLRGAPERYASLLEAKEDLLKHEPGNAARQLVQLTERMADLHNQDRELQEAIQAGQRVQAGIDGAVSALESASNWGTWDLLGGGMLSSAIKHGKLDDANQAIQEVQPLLQRFQRELADVQGMTGLQVQTDGLESFIDIFFDGLLVDLLVQSKINDSLEAARSMQKRVRGLVEDLAHRKQALQAEVSAVDRERLAVLEQS
jgi:DNA repair exonuclease SbcCD ATPase subunit